MDASKFGSRFVLLIAGVAAVAAPCLAGLTAAGQDAAVATYTFGVRDPSAVLSESAIPEDITRQGVNNFYFYYSPLHNVNGFITENSIGECVYSAMTMVSCMAPPEEAILRFMENWPNRYPSEPFAQFDWHINGYGTVIPAGDLSAVVGFKAPADGRYVVEAHYDGGAKPFGGGLRDEADGVAFGLIFRDTLLWSRDTGRAFSTAGNAYAAPVQTLDMAKGESVYFSVDPKASYHNDYGHLSVKVIRYPKETTTIAATERTGRSTAPAKTARTSADNSGPAKSAPPSTHKSAPSPMTGSTVPGGFAPESPSPGGTDAGTYDAADPSAASSIADGDGTAAGSAESAGAPAAVVSGGSGGGRAGFSVIGLAALILAAGIVGYLLISRKRGKPVLLPEPQEEQPPAA